MEHMLYIWLSILCVGLIVEAINAGTLVSIWFSAGAVIPMIMSFWGITHPAYIALQVIIFGVVTVLCLVLVRKRTKKLLYKNSRKTNGIEYSAILENDDEVNDLQLGDKVTILRFEGNKAIVKKV